MNSLGKCLFPEGFLFSLKYLTSEMFQCTFGCIIEDILKTKLVMSKSLKRLVGGGGVMWSHSSLGVAVDMCFTRTDD